MRAGCQTLFFILALSCCCISSSAEDVDYDPVAAAKQMSADIISVRSPSGRFLVIADDRLDAYDFARWAEDIVLRLERLTGVEIPAEKEPLMKVFFVADGDASPSVNVDRGSGGYAVTFSGYSSNLVEAAMEAICRASMQTIAEDGLGVVSGSSQFPFWMAQGIAQNLYPELRKRNSEHILKQWHNGRMPSLDSLMDDGSVTDDKEGLRMARGVLFSWLMSFGRDMDLINAAVRSAMKNDEFGRAELLEVLSTAGINDLDYEWDAWMLRQKRTVFMPGDATAEDLAWLKRQLLIYPNEFDTQISDSSVSDVAFEDLIDLKKKDWIKAAVQSRLSELQLKSAGKSDEFRKVVELFRDYLKGVLDEEADWRLRRKWKLADENLGYFETKLMNASIEDKDAYGKQELNEQKGQ